ncbi:hypothetical protein AXF42_Ash000309 [Apostasia shenzhenica]|uniref:Uncharacterized protein n=1 Tax=Apostasia shenzhenica TaxID=1088818 RepID=A0A2I0AG31_9ASPA|nr:hypothetical protein AXF42_Ash000309 [Apostasia shenzhenica]
MAASTHHLLLALLLLGTSAATIRARMSWIPVTDEHLIQTITELAVQAYNVFVLPTSSTLVAVADPELVLKDPTFHGQVDSYAVTFQGFLLYRSWHRPSTPEIAIQILIKVVAGRPLIPENVIPQSIELYVVGEP